MAIKFSKKNPLRNLRQKLLGKRSVKARERQTAKAEKMREIKE